MKVLMKFAIIAFTCLIPHLTHAVDFDALKWKEVLKKDNVVMSLASVPGSDIEAFRGVSIYKNATLPQLVSLLSDMNSLTSILHGSVAAKSIKLDSATQTQICWYEIKVPWPYQNRDFSIEQTTQRTGENSALITLRAKPSLVPPTKGKVRVKDMHVTMRLTVVGEGRVELEYTGHVDPAGNLPGWLVNAMLTDTPVNTMKNIAKADLSKYDPNNSSMLPDINP